MLLQGRVLGSCSSAHGVGMGCQSQPRLLQTLLLLLGLLLVLLLLLLLLALEPLELLHRDGRRRGIGLLLTLLVPGLRVLALSAAGLWLRVEVERGGGQGANLLHQASQYLVEQLDAAVVHLHEHA